MANTVYTEFIYRFMLQQMDITTSPLKVILLNSTYVPNPDHKFYRDISSYEITGNNYTVGGNTLSSVDIVRDDINNIIKITADTVTWESSSITSKFAVIYEVSSGALIACFDFGSQKTSLNGNFSVSWPIEGLIQMGGSNSIFGETSDLFTLVQSPVEG